MNRFHYDTLPIKGSEVRLLHLYQGTGVIECELMGVQLRHNVSFQDGRQENSMSPHYYPLYDCDKTPYEALSYTWGAAEFSEQIIVNGQSFDITESLYVALQHLRLGDSARSLWIDAICINQGNEEERSQQVQQMGSIYKQADKVILWLGQATYMTNVIFDSLECLERNNGFQDHLHITEEQLCKHWELVQPGLEKLHPGLKSLQRTGLRDLFGRPWFRRVWILQEVANARNAIVCCGARSIPTQYFVHTPKLMNVSPDSHCQAILDIMPGQYREESWWSKKPVLYTLLKKFRDSKASDERDMIFALRDLSSDANNSELLRADYTKTAAQVVNLAKEFMFGTYVHRHWTPKTLEDLLPTIELLKERALNQAIIELDAVRLQDHLQRFPNEIIIEEQQVECAARNSLHGEEVMQVLVKSLQADVRITDFVIGSAIRNLHFGQQIITLLLHQENEIHLSEKSVLSFLQWSRGKILENVEFVLRQEKPTFEVTKQVIVTAMKAKLKDETVMLLLKRRNSDLDITARFLADAVEHHTDHESFEWVLPLNGGTEVTEAMILAAIRAMRKMIDMLSYSMQD